MFIIKRLWMFFIILLSCASYSFCSEDVRVIELEPIIVSNPEEESYNPYRIYFNNKKNHTESFIEALSFLPMDLQSRSLKGDIQTDFSIRGSNFQGVLISLDSNRINDPQTGHHNSDIPLTQFDIEKTEIVSPCLTMLYGAGAIGGILDIKTKKPQSNGMVLELKGASHDTASVGYSISHKKGDIGLRYSIENQESEGFHEDTGYKNLTTRFTSTLDMPDKEGSFAFGYQEKEFGAYDFYTPGQGYPSKEWTKTYLLNTDFKVNNNICSIQPKFLWRRHYDKFMLDKTQIRSSFLSRHYTDVITPNVYFQKETKDFGTFGFGMEYSEESISSTTLNNHNRNFRSMFLDDSIALNDSLFFNISGRLDNSNYFHNIYTGGINAKYRIDQDNTLSFGLSRNTRIPSFTELYYNDPTTAGNLGLSEEAAVNYEIRYGYEKNKLQSGMAFFHREESQMIDWIKHSDSQVKWQAENLSDTNIFGVENYFKYSITPYLTIDSNYSYINKMPINENYIYKYGNNVIKHQLNTNLNLNLPLVTQVLGVNYKKKIHRDEWILVDSRTSYNVHKSSRIFLNITNIFNVEYQEIEGIPQPRRIIEAGIRFEF